MNDTLCRALLKARLSEEDIAARLEVDPKTVRRWLEGRVPYLRYRWALAALLGLDETDLWPQLRPPGSRPGEVRAIYPHRDALPQEVWHDLLGSAEHEISILADDALFLAEDTGILATLAGRARAGVRIRVCLSDPDAPDAAEGSADGSSEGLRSARIGKVIALCTPLREIGETEIRLHRAVLYNSICRADDQLLVSQRAYGIPAGQSPVLYLRQADSSEIATAYLESFDRIWVSARRLD